MEPLNPIPFKPVAPYIVYYYSPMLKGHRHGAFTTKREAISYAKSRHGAVIDIRTLEYIYKHEEWK
jgi:hypothetical protein